MLQESTPDDGVDVFPVLPQYLGPACWLDNEFGVREDNVVGVEDDPACLSIANRPAILVEIPVYVYPHAVHLVLIYPLGLPPALRVTPAPEGRVAHLVAK